MKRPVWVRRNEVDAIHDELVMDFGGLMGVRDGALIDSALGRPQNLFAHAKPDLAALAAAYAYGLVKNHGYLDGNKRTAFVTCGTFLVLNGLQPIAAEAETEAAILALA